MGCESVNAANSTCNLLRALRFSRELLELFCKGTPDKKIDKMYVSMYLGIFGTRVHVSMYLCTKVAVEAEAGRYLPKVQAGGWWWGCDIRSE